MNMNNKFQKHGRAGHALIEEYIENRKQAV
jgi:hypothetical protein